MSASNQAAGPSTNNFATVFADASSKYSKITGTQLEAPSHRFSAILAAHSSPEDVLDLLQMQAQVSVGLDDCSKLMESLDPIVRVLFAFLAKLAKGTNLPVSPAGTMFIAIGVLLSAEKNVAGSYSRLANLFGRIDVVLPRLAVYTGVPLTNELTELLWKIMAQLLSILALSTRSMTEGRLKRFARRLEGRTDIEDALSRLEMLMNSESRLVVARTLDLMSRVDLNISKIEGIVHGRKPGYSENIAPPTDNFTALFDAASSEYQKKTGKSLETHPLAEWLGIYDSPEDVLVALRIQAHTIGESDKGNELMDLLDPIVRVLSHFLASLANGIGLPFSPARTMFIAIDILLSSAKNVAGSFSKLVDLFERIHLILQSLKVYTRISLTNKLTELLGKIMAQLLSILALSTRVIKEGRFKTFARREGRTDIEDALSQLEMLMNEESRLVAARTLDVMQRANISIKKAEEFVHGRKPGSSEFTPAMSIHRPTDSFTDPFTAALSEYEKMTGKPLGIHPPAEWLGTCGSPEDVLIALCIRAHTIGESDEGNELKRSLDPIVHVLFKFSAALAKGIDLTLSPAQVIFAAIDVLLSAAKNVAGSYSRLTSLFERIHFVLPHLNVYTGVPLTNELSELLGKIMAQLLSILALSTRMMTEGRLKMFARTLQKRTDIQDALSRLEVLMNSESRLVAARALELVDHVDKATGEITDDLNRYRLQEKLRTWLSPPDPSESSIHNNACKTRQDGTSMWFIKDSVFQEWKKDGPLLWISGNPGAGKTILCSAMIEYIKSMREAEQVLVAYHYFNIKDAPNRNLRGLLTSLLFQLSYGSDRCLDVLYNLYATRGDGSQHPSNTALEECLKNMLQLPGQLPFVIVDALDECPSNPRSASVRQDVLDFVKRLVGSSYSNLFICIFSRPEQDIGAVLDPLTSPSRRVSLRQMEDIQRYIQTFVDTSFDMRKWSRQDKDLVICTLSSQARGNFRWAFFQLEMLRQCLPENIRKALEELPNSSLELEGSTTMEQIYERALQNIPLETQRHAHHLFQCLIAAFRPLRVEEIGAILFDLDSTLHHVNGRGPKNVQDVLSPCSIFLDNIQHEGSRIIQFCHSSVKEFLTSDRLRTSDLENNSCCYISLDAAHATLAKRCLNALSQVNEHDPTPSPLALYAAEYWVKHAKFKDVASEIQDEMERLFDPMRQQRLAAWTRLHDVDRSWAPMGVPGECQLTAEPEGTPLYYAVLCGFSRLAEHLITKKHAQVNAECGTRGTSLHAASAEGHLDAVGVLLRHGADVNATDKRKMTPLCAAYHGGHLEVMRLLLEHTPAVEPDKLLSHSGFLLHTASSRGQAEVVTMLLAHGAKVNAKGISDWTPLHWASANGHPKIVDILIDHKADIDARSKTDATPLRLALGNGHLDVVQRLLNKKAKVDIVGKDGRTPYEVAKSSGHRAVAELLLQHTEKEHRASDCRTWDCEYCNLIT